MVIALPDAVVAMLTPHFAIEKGVCSDAGIAEVEVGVEMVVLQ